MKNLLNLLCGLVLIALLVSCATTQKNSNAIFSSQPTPERWNFNFDSRKWHLGSQGANKDSTLREYVLEGQTVDNWQELVSSQSSAVRVKPRVMYDYFKSQISQDCPSLQIFIIEESMDNILFEWKHGGCQEFPAQDEIQRIVLTPNGTFVLHYAAKTPQLTSEVRDTWISIIKSATVRSDK
jgi:hypothetical protein